MTQLNFDATQVAPAAAFDPLPSDKYVAAITASEVKPTKAGTGSYLQLEFTVLDGEYKGRKVWDRLNLNNPNAQAVSIARSQLSAICHAVKILQVRESAQLHNIPLVITVKLKQDADGEMYNEIKGYSQRESLIPKTAPATPEQQQQAEQFPQNTAANKNDTAPW